MLVKAVCAIFTNKYRPIFSTVITRTLLTKSQQKWLNSAIPPQTSSIGENSKDFTRQKTAISFLHNRVTRQKRGAVRLGFIPNEWLTFFLPKTGVTGLGTFTFTFSIFLMSKEFYVMEHEYYNGLSMAILCILVVKYIGPEIAKLLDREIDSYEHSWTEIKNNNNKALEDGIKHEKHLQWSNEGQLMLVEAKRENVGLQLEAAYRERLMFAYSETVKRLQYCTAFQEVEEAICRRHMHNWVVEEVRKAVTENIKKDALDHCFKDLQELAQTFKGLLADYPPPESDSEPSSEVPPDSPDKNKPIK